MKGDWTPSVTLVDKIADELRERIIDGTVQAGKHLQQASLAKKLGVSSIPFREALRILETEGFVEVVPFKGYKVKRLSVEDFAERVQIAFALESLAIEQALPTLTGQDLDRAEELANGLYPVKGIDSWYAPLFELFSIIFGANHRPVLFELIRRNRMAARRYTEIVVRETIQDPPWARQWVLGYFPLLVELIRSKDVEAAKDLHRRRMEDAVALILPRLSGGAGENKGRKGPLHRLKGTQAAQARKKDILAGAKR
jgi:DNA-binding GntR family transcriptional regulator